MKKQIFYLASAALAVGLAACSNELIDDEVSNITLQEGELAAAFEGVEQEDADTRVKLEGTKISWDRDNGGEKIAVYSEALDAYYEYDLKNTTAEDKAKAVFSVANKNALPADFKPTLAFYPYSDELLNDVSGGQFLYALEADNDYVPGAINMPMVGKVSNGTINFTNTAALLKVTVVNMPAGKHYAKLSHGNKSISGSAQIDLEETPYTLKMQSNEASYIKYNATAALTGASQTSVSSNDDDDAKSVAEAYQFKAGATYDFYFVLPAGTYDKTLTFALGNYTVAGADHDDTGNAAYSRALSIKRNTMYSTTLRYTDDASPVIESGNLAALNKQLANATTTGEFTADLSGEKGNIYIPELANTSDVITLNLTLGESTEKAITIKSTGKNTPKVVVNVAGSLKTAATQGAKAVYNAPTIDIELPNSVVTVAPASNAADNKVTIASLTANTYEDILTIKKGVTVTKLVLSESANAFAEDGATITDATGTQYKNYVFYQTADDVKYDEASGKASKGTEKMYKLYYPESGSTVPLDAGKTEVKKEITISKDKTVTIDLGGDGNSLEQGTDALSVLKVAGTLTIKGTTGSIASAKNAPAIDIVAGGVVNFEGGSITKTSNSVPVQTAGTFNMTGGKITAVASSTAIAVVAKGKAIINTTTDATAENATADVNGNVTVAAEGEFDLQGGFVSGTVTATGTAGSEQAPTAAAKVAISGGTLQTTGASALALTAASYGPVEAIISGGTVASNDDTVVLTGVSGDTTKPSLTISGGAVTTSGSNKNVIKDATGGAAIAISGGVVKNVTVADNKETLQGTAIALTQKSDLTITGGSVLAGTTAIDITNGTLEVSGSNEVALQGDNVISATSTTNSVKVTLSNANATYTATGTGSKKVFTSLTDGFVLYNYSISDTANAAKIDAKSSISAGRFIGDVVTTGVKIITGGFFSSSDILYANQKDYLAEGKILSWVDGKDYWEVKSEVH